MTDARNWKPIETAPDCCLILGRANGMVRLMFLENGEWKVVGSSIVATWFEPEEWCEVPHD